MALPRSAVRSFFPPGCKERPPRLNFPSNASATGPSSDRISAPPAEADSDKSPFRGHVAAASHSRPSGEQQSAQTGPGGCLESESQRCTYASAFHKGTLPFQLHTGPLPPVGTGRPACAPDGSARLTLPPLLPAAASGETDPRTPASGSSGRDLLLLLALGCGSSGPGGGPPGEPQPAAAAASGAEKASILHLLDDKSILDRGGGGSGCGWGTPCGGAAGWGSAMSTPATVPSPSLLLAAGGDFRCTPGGMCPPCHGGCLLSPAAGRAASGGGGPAVSFTAHRPATLPAAQPMPVSAAARGGAAGAGGGRRGTLDGAMELEACKVPVPPTPLPPTSDGTSQVSSSSFVVHLVDRI
jgi:hypothetical protein